jgi:hypothetical protein
MKSRAILFIVLISFLSGCNLIKKASEVKISTSLTTDLPVVVVAAPTKSLDLNAVVTDINFSKSLDLVLDSNPDIKPYLSKIRSISLKSLLITINGLSAGQTITTVSLAVDGVGTIFTRTGITMENNSFTPVIAAGVLDNVSAKLLSDKKITLTVSGAASGPMTFTVNCNFDTSVTASVL